MIERRSPALRYAVVGASLLGVCVAIGFAVKGTSAQLAIERPLTDFLRPYTVDLSLLRRRGQHDWRQLLSSFGEPTFLFAWVVSMATFCWAKRDRVMLAVATAGPIVSAVLLQELAKPFFDRTPGPDFVYPSGHSASAAALAVATLMLVRRYSDGHTGRALVALIVATPLVTGFGLLLLRAHYPLDVVGGLTFGAGVVMIARAAAELLVGPQAQAPELRSSASRSLASENRP